MDFASGVVLVIKLSGSISGVEKIIGAAFRHTSDEMMNGGGLDIGSLAIVM